MNILSSKKNDKKITGNYYEDSTQKWLPIETVVNGIVVLKGGRYIKILVYQAVLHYLNLIRKEN